MSLTKKYLLHSSTFFSEYKCEYREKCQYLEKSKKTLALFGSICGIDISITSDKKPKEKKTIILPLFPSLPAKTQIKKT